MGDTSSKASQRILFTGYAPVHFACFRPLYERLVHLPGIEMFLSGGLRTKTADGDAYDEQGLYSQFGLPQDRILSVAEVRTRDFDVVFAASTDLRSFSGWSQGDPRYEEMITSIRDATLDAGLVMGGPMAWSDREGFQFFQAPGSGSLIRRGARAVLEGARSNVAPIEGSERR